MRVLYVLANYPQASESYIEAEIKYVRSCGIEVEVWSAVEGYGDPSPVRVHRAGIKAAVAEFKPNLVHVHYLVTAIEVLPRIPSIPATVRAHSFDWTAARAMTTLAIPSVRSIYAFPHFAREINDRRIVSMPVAYDAGLYDAPMDKPVARDRVVRLAAGRRVKGLDDFLQVSSSISPRGTFHLAACQVRGDEAYVLDLLWRCKRHSVHGHMNVGRTTAVEMIRTAGIYLETSDSAGHSFGMPVSVAEAMAAGLIVLVRDCPAAREYIGEAGAVYSSVAEAVQYVEIALSLPQAADEASRALSRQRARAFRSDVVLPRLVEDWKRFAE